MKILVFNWQDIRNPLAGGAEVHLHEVFARIAAMGHDVTLYCSAFPGAAREETLNGIRVIREGGRYLFNFRVAFAYLTRFRHEGYDVIVDDVNKIPFFTPVFVTKPLYGVIHHLFDKSIFKEASFPLAAYVYLMERRAVRMYRARNIPFIVGSPSTHGEMIAHGFRPDDVALINYAVDHGLFRRTGVAKSETPLIGYFGRLKKYKSVDHLLQALALVRARVPTLKALVVGEGDDRARLENIARNLGIADVVTFTGFVSEEEKVTLLQKMWIKVTTSSKEGWGLTVLEANACGTPVIASNVQGLRDAVKDGQTGLLYPYGDVKALADKIVQVVNDDALRARLTEQSLVWAAEFSWDLAARRTLALLEERVRKHEAPVMV